MSELERLIAELCPDLPAGRQVGGVEVKKLCEVLTIKNGKDYKSFAKGAYPVYGSGGVMTYIDTFVCDKPSVLIPRKGSLDKLYYVDVPFWTVDTIFWTEIDAEIIQPKFVYYYLQTQHLEDLNMAGGVPSLTQSILNEVPIPLPPLPVQQEIVRILDNFTELTAELKAELTAELAARKKQYEYYRDELLYIKNAVPMVSLKTVVKRSSSGSTPTKGVNAYYENGTVPWLRTQDVKFNEIYEIKSFITEEAVEKTSAKWIPENCVIVAISGATAGRCAINKIATTTNQHCLNMEIDSSKALYKYVYYCVYSRYEELISRKQGARGDLNSTLIMGIEIPLPPIKEQERIVKILDQFDALVNDISIGLPAEIEARRKQYEYYRDKLLTFKEASA